MKIKDIKTQYANYGGYRNCKFVVYDFKGEIGKAVIVVNCERVCGETWRDVVQAVRVSDGKELIEPGRCRPCDNLLDAVDVANEMIDEYMKKIWAAAKEEKTYFVKEDYWPEWGDSYNGEPIKFSEIQRLSTEWGKPLDELMEELEVE